MKIFELTTADFEIFKRKNNSIPQMSMPHIHEAYELTLMLSGEISYLFKNSVTKVTKGSVILIKPFEIHKTIPYEGEYERVIIHFNSNIFSSVFSEDLTNEILSVFSNQHTEITKASIPKFTQLLLDCKVHFDNGNTELATIYLARFLMGISRFGLYSKKKKITPIASDIIYYINNNISKVTISDVCKKFYMSPQSLNTFFKKELFMTPHRYIDVLRMSYALELLNEGNLSIDEVAFFCGYNSLSYFSSKFKRIYGTTPLYYRKSQKSSERACYR